MMHTLNKKEFNTTGWIILAQVAAASTGFLILMSVFEIPDILRMTAEYRFSLFVEKKSIIIPVYYLLALTGISQIIISVLIFLTFKEKSTILILGAIFGILCGTFQAMGFIRWSILTP